MYEKTKINKKRLAFSFSLSYVKNVSALVPALLPVSVDDGQKVDVIWNDVAAAPSRHVEVLVEHRLSDVLFKRVQRFDENLPSFEHLTVVFKIR